MSKTIPSIMKTVTPNQNTTFDSPSISHKMNTVKSSVRNTLDPLTENINNTIQHKNGYGFMRILLISFLVISILLLIYNSYLYFSEGTDILDKHFNIDISKYFQNEKIGAKSFIKSTLDTIDVRKQNLDLSKSNKVIRDSKKSPIERKPPKVDRPTVQSESSFKSSFKKSKTKGFCYIGTDRNHRSCVEIRPGDVCSSNEIYPTMDICINPNLRQ